KPNAPTGIGCRAQSIWSCGQPSEAVVRWDLLIARLRPLLRRSRIEDELEAELRFHVDELIEENRRFGMGAAEARRAALRAIGGIASIKDECRESLGLRTLDGLRQDGRSACRALRKHPGFTIVAVLILAVGIGATTAMFTVADTLVFRPA